MVMSHGTPVTVAISTETVEALRIFADALCPVLEMIRADTEDLLAQYAALADTLGVREAPVLEMLRCVETAQNLAAKAVEVLPPVMHETADQMEKFLCRYPTCEAVSPPADLDRYLAGVQARIYASGYRKLRAPSSGGTWEGDVFHPDLDVIPKRYNPDGLTFGQIIEKVERLYGLHYTGTPFTEGFADFSGIALAQIGLEKLMRSSGDEHIEDDLHGTFSDDRNDNFSLADLAAAEMGIPIPGLGEKYTAAKLAQWRKDNRFTWDESMVYGCLLVPSELHNNIDHTGLVAIAKRADQAVARIQKRWKHSG